MNAGQRRTAGFVIVLILPAVLTFAVVRLLQADDGDDHRADPPNVNGSAVKSGPVGPASPATGVDPGGAVDLAARFASPADGSELTFQIGRARAEAGPPSHITDCLRFAEWAQQNGGIPVGFEPSHVLVVHARRSLDLNAVSIAVIPVAQVSLTAEDGPWVELACRDDTPPRASPAGARPTLQEGIDDRPHVLTAGQTIELPVALDPLDETGKVFPHGVSDYQLEVQTEIDGVYETYRLKNGASDFRCCGRTTFMGYQAARYEWNLSPFRSLRLCAELRFAEEPPPPTCTVSQR